jgi:hypothetical protein
MQRGLVGIGWHVVFLLLQQCGLCQTGSQGAYTLSVI